MSPEETARYHADRPGFELIDFAEVGLPIFKVYVSASLLLHTPLPPIFEFVLRCIRLGIDSPAEVAACLGIPTRMVDQSLKALHSAEEIAFVPGDAPTPERFTLTRRGTRTVESLELILPERQTLPIYFDGLTRRPIAPPASPLLSGRQAIDQGLKEIPALPATRIEVQDIDVTAAAKIFGRERSGEQRRDLLSIKGIERRLRLHLPAVALVYRSKGGDEVELFFASEAALLDEHSRAFALNEGPKKTRLFGELAKPDMIGKDSFSRRMATLEKRVASTGGKRRHVTIMDRPMQEAEPDAIKALGPLDHSPILHDAIATARETLLIICPWITSQVVDAPMLASIEAMLKRDVTFYLGYGLDDEESQPKPIPRRLQEMADRHSNFRLVHLGNTHEKVLIKDQDLCVVTSFNWLSFRGDPTRKLRRERGVMIKEPGFVSDEFRKLVTNFRKRKTDIEVIVKRARRKFG